MSERFARIPISVISELDSKLEWKVWAAIASYYSPKSPVVFARQRTMADLAGISEASFSIGVRKLAAKGLIEITRTMKGNKYELPCFNTTKSMDCKPMKSMDCKPMKSTTPNLRNPLHQTYEIDDTKPMKSMDVDITDHLTDHLTDKDNKQAAAAGLELFPAELDSKKIKLVTSEEPSFENQAQELWDHWRKLNPRVRSKKPPASEIKYLPEALKEFKVDELKTAISGVKAMVATWDWNKPASFHFSFSKSCGGGKKSFNEDRVNECIVFAGEESAEKLSKKSGGFHNKFMAFAKKFEEELWQNKGVATDGEERFCGIETDGWVELKVGSMSLKTPKKTSLSHPIMMQEAAQIFLDAAKTDDAKAWSAETLRIQKTFVTAAVKESMPRQQKIDEQRQYEEDHPEEFCDDVDVETMWDELKPIGDAA